MAGGTRELPAALDLALTSHELPAEVGGAGGQTGGEGRAGPGRHTWPRQEGVAPGAPADNSVAAV